jgi:hypothetical protein
MKNSEMKKNLLSNFLNLRRLLDFLALPSLSLSSFSRTFHKRLLTNSTLSLSQNFYLIFYIIFFPVYEEKQQ